MNRCQGGKASRLVPSNRLFPMVTVTNWSPNRSTLNSCNFAVFWRIELKLVALESWKVSLFHSIIFIGKSSGLKSSVVPRPTYATNRPEFISDGEINDSVSDHCIVTASIKKYWALIKRTKTSTNCFIHESLPDCWLAQRLPRPHESSNSRSNPRDWEYWLRFGGVGGHDLGCSAASRTNAQNSNQASNEDMDDIWNLPPLQEKVSPV